MSTELEEAFCLFERLDKSCKGCIEVSDLIYVYQRLSPEFNSGLQRLLEAQGKSEKDKLRFHEFCLLIGDEAPDGPPAAPTNGDAPPADPPAEPPTEPPANIIVEVADREPAEQASPAEEDQEKEAPVEEPAKEQPAEEAAPAEEKPADEATPAEDTPPAEDKPGEEVKAPARRKAAGGATRGKRKDPLEKAPRAQRHPGIDWKKFDPSNWVFTEVQFNGSYSYHQEPRIDKVEAQISLAKEDLKSNPEPNQGLFYQSSMMDWPEDQQKYELVKRTGSGFKVSPDPDGHFTWVEAKYQALPSDVSVEPDAYTDKMHIGGQLLASPRMPGRGEGCNDVPHIKVVDYAHPRDVLQGGVGDCWLLCAMSAIAEFRGVIRSLFKNTPDMDQRPLKTFNHYTVSLYDISTPEWKPVDVVVDERLCSKPCKSSLLGAHPNERGELWSCYLEKAIAAHCGGWDEIDGGTCTHAWRLMLGCKHVYTFKRKGDVFECFGTFNPNTNEWEQLDNSPHKGFKGLWPMAWPEVGGGGDLDLTLNEDDFFDRLCAWDDANYIMACGSEAGSDKTAVDGIVQGHAYTILDCVQNPGSVDVDLIKIRNPWGHGEFTDGKWVDGGSGWTEHPEVKAAINPVDADDGCFWMEADEFFAFFPTVYLCALDMTTLQK